MRPILCSLGFHKKSATNQKKKDEEGRVYKWRNILICERCGKIFFKGVWREIKRRSY